MQNCDYNSAALVNPIFCLEGFSSLEDSLLVSYFLIDVFAYNVLLGICRDHSHKKNKSRHFLKNIAWRT